MLTKFIDEKFPKWAKILLCIFCGGAGVYRVMIYIDQCIANEEPKNTKALVWGIVCCCLYPVAIVLGIIDAISINKEDKWSDKAR